MARVGCLHAARARRHGVRRGDDEDTTDGDRRTVGSAAQGARTAALVELTAFIALANFMARSNVAMGIDSQGFSAACDLKPLALASSA